MAQLDFSGFWQFYLVALAILLMVATIFSIILAGVTTIWLAQKFIRMFIIFRHEYWPIHSLRTEKEIEDGKREYLARPDCERHLWMKTGRDCEQQLEVLATVWDMDGYYGDAESLRDIAIKMRDTRKKLDQYRLRSAARISNEGGD